MEEINKEQFLKKYEEHQKWLGGNTKGERLVWNFRINFEFSFNFKLNLCSADLSSANLSSADLSSANLRSADLSSANLSYADLSSANLRSADLSYANLSSANLSSADLCSANLRSTNLRYANLRSADLRYADLDYSCWPLWCGSKDVTLDLRLQAQLLGHIKDACKDVKFTDEQIDFIYKNWNRASEFLGGKLC